ncbi:MAG: molybdate ABC transporter substrate-binding protein [Thalassobaculaceae bacterium]
MVAAIGKRAGIGGAMARKAELGGVRRWAILALALVAMSGAAPAAAGEAVLFAAASTRNAVVEAAALFARASDHRLTPVFASSGRLARQIIRGAPADLYLGANRQWAAVVVDAGLAPPVDAATVLLTNRLVLATTAATPPVIDLAVPGELAAELAAVLGDGRLAIADPQTVPLGIYGRAALTALGVWSLVAERLAPARNARQALAFVEQGAAPLGLLYLSDVATSRRARVLATLPETTHPPIRYPLLRLTDTPATRAAEAFLRGPAARAVFARHGFQRAP